MKIDEIVKLNKLFDLYGNLLNKNQKQLAEEYLKNNLSFSEIAENRNVSRQNSFITVSKVLKKLENYEEKVGALKEIERLKQMTNDK